MGTGLDSILPSLLTSLRALALVSRLGSFVKKLPKTLNPKPQQFLIFAWGGDPKP